MKLIICNKELGIIHTVDNLLDLYNYVKQVACFEQKNETNTSYHLYLMVDSPATDEDEIDINRLMEDIGITLKGFINFTKTFDSARKISYNEMKKELKEAYDRSEKND